LSLLSAIASRRRPVAPRSKSAPVDGELLHRCRVLDAGIVDAQFCAVDSTIAATSAGFAASEGLNAVLTPILLDLRPPVFDRRRLAGAIQHDVAAACATARTMPLTACIKMAALSFSIHPCRTCGRPGLSASNVEIGVGLFG
jgi:hypothetical protein